LDAPSICSGGANQRAAMDKAVEHSLISGIPAARSAAGTVIIRHDVKRL